MCLTSGEHRSPSDGPDAEPLRVAPWLSRRGFFRRVILAGAGIGVATEAMSSQARTKGSGSIRWTRQVRAVTRTLLIPRGRWKWIIAHHSGVAQGNAVIYGKAHRQRGMENGLAYHFLIGNGVDSDDGEIEIGPRWRKQIGGGHVRQFDMNEVAIGICLVGNFQQNSPTPRQLMAFRELVDYLRSEVVGAKIRFAVHREIDPGHTVCPGRWFPTEEMHRRYGALRKG